MYPRRAAEICEGGSIYRVIGGRILCRQRITAIRPDTREDGTACALVVMAPEIIPVSPRAMRPFQGWRYLRPEDAPLTCGPAAIVAMYCPRPCATNWRNCA